MPTLTMRISTRLLAAAQTRHNQMHLRGEKVTTKTYLYVLHKHVPDYLALGWIKHDSLDGTHHGHYSKLMEWPFSDRPIETPPRREGKDTRQLPADCEDSSIA